MRIATKITLAVTVWTVLVLVLYGWLKHQEEHALMEQDLFEECLLAVNLVRPSLEEAHLRGGLPAVESLLTSVRAQPDDLGLRLVHPEDLTGHAPSLPLPRLHAAKHQGDAGPIFVRPESGERRMFVYVPIPAFGEGWLVEASASRQDDTLRENEAIWETTFLSAIIAIVSMVLAGLTGWWQVGSRVQSLASMARAAGEGVDPQRVPTDSDDELGALSREMNRMADMLQHMRATNEAETSLRTRLAEDLRHADRLATIGMLMSRVAHEIGTPLNVVAARARRIERGQVEGEAARTNARIAAEQADRIRDIIRGLLDYSRKETARARVAPRLLCERALLMVDGLARSREVIVRELVQEGLDSPGIPELVVDGTLIEQALVNLLVNAIHASPPGGEVEMRLAHGHFPPPDGGAPREVVRIEVADQGPGVPDEVRQQIFQPFFTTKPPGEGTGLGLSITVSIIAEHGGWIEVHKGREAGALFAVCLNPAPPEPTLPPTERG